MTYENDELMIAGSELPVLDEKGRYKYFDEVSGNGAYFQVAWLKVKGKGFVSLYGTEAIKLIDNLNSLEDVFFDEQFDNNELLEEGDE